VKKLLFAFYALFIVAEQASAGTYLDSIFQNPTHPQVSVGATFSSQFKANGAATALAVVYHPADPKTSLIPDTIQALGVAPVSWAINLGGGGNSGSYFVPMGFTANLTPTVLGPGLKLLNDSGNPILKGIASVISSQNGGVAFGPQWTAYPIVDGVFVPFNKYRMAPGYFCGAAYRF